MNSLDADSLHLPIAWVGSTVFSGATLLDHIANQINYLTITGWIITSFLTIIASIYRIVQTRAEIRKSNAIADKIEKDVEEEELTSSSSNICKFDLCKYKSFYNDFNPIIIDHFKKEEEKES